MGAIGGIYVTIDGDTVPLQQAMTRARGIVREAAGDIGTSLNGALSGGQINAGLNSLVGNLQRLQGASGLTRDSFKGVGVSLQEVQGITGLTDAQFKTIQERMLQTSAQNSAERAFKALQAQTNMTARELAAMGIKLPDLNTAMRGAGGAGQALTSSMASLGSVVAGGLGLATLTAMTKQALTTFLEFEKAISLVKSVAGATDAEMKSLANSARQMSALTTFAAKEVAQGQYYLASAGQNANQIMRSQVGVLMLAQATQTDLAFSSETVASALSQFSLAADESSRVANVYAAACATSQATVQKLADSMRYVGPIAKSLGMDLETTVASLNLLYDAGLRGEQAGTGLRSAMLRLQDPSKEMADLFRDLGVTFRNADGTAKPFLEVLGQLRKANLDAGTAAKLFGMESATAVLTLANNLDKLDEAKAKITGTGEAYKQAGEQMNALWADMKKLGSAVADLSITIVDKLSPALRAATQDATQMVGMLSRGLSGGKLKIDVNDLNLLEQQLAQAKERLEFLKGDWLGRAMNPFQASMLKDQAVYMAALLAKIEELKTAQRAAAGDFDDYTARVKALAAAGQEAASGLTSMATATEAAAKRFMASAKLEADKTLIGARADSLDKTIAQVNKEKEIKRKAIDESNATDLEKDAQRKALEITTGAEIVAARTTWGRKYAEVTLSNQGELLAARQRYAEYVGDIDQQEALARLQTANDLQAKMQAADNAGTYNAQFFDELRNQNAARLDREWADKRAAAVVALNETLYGLNSVSASQLANIYQDDYNRRLQIIDQGNASETTKLTQRAEAYKTFVGRLQSLTASEEATIRAMLEAGAASPQAMVDLYNKALAQAIPGTREYYDLANKLRQADLDAAGKFSDAWVRLTIKGYELAYQQGKISAQEYWTQVYELEKSALERHQRMLDARIALEKAQLQTSKKNWDSAWDGITEAARVAFDEILATQKSWGALSYDAWKDSYKSMTDFLGSGFVDVAKLDFEKLEDDFQSFCDAVVKAWLNALAQMTAQSIASGIASLLNGTFNLGINITGNNPAGILGTLSSGATLVSGGSKLAGWLGLGGAPAVTAAGLGGDIYAGIATQVAEMFAAEQAGTASYLIAESGAVAPGSTGLLAGLQGKLTAASEAIKGWFGVAAGEAAPAAAQAGAALGSEMSLGFSTSLAWIGGALALGELLGKLTGGVGPIGAVMEMISGGQGHTAQSALAYIKADMEAINRMSAGMDKVLFQDVTGGMASQRILDDIKTEADEIKLLGERANLTKDQINLLLTGGKALEQQLARAIDSGDKQAASLAAQKIEQLKAIQAATGIQGLDGVSASMAQLSQISATIGPQIEQIVQTGANGMYTVGGAVQTVADKMLTMANAMGLPVATTESLTSKINELVGAWRVGNIDADALAQTLQNQFVLALESASLAGMDLTQILKELPSELTIDIITNHIERYLGGDAPEENGGPGPGALVDPVNRLPSYDVGGWIKATGPAWVHAEEYVLNHQNIADLRSGKLHLGLPQTAPAATQPVMVKGGDTYLTIVTPDGQELRREILRAAALGPAPQRLRIDL